MQHVFLYNEEIVSGCLCCSSIKKERELLSKYTKSFFFANTFWGNGWRGLLCGWVFLVVVVVVEGSIANVGRRREVRRGRNGNVAAATRTQPCHTPPKTLSCSLKFSFSQRVTFYLFSLAVEEWAGSLSQTQIIRQVEVKARQGKASGLRWAERELKWCAAL